MIKKALIFILLALSCACNKYNDYTDSSLDSLPDNYVGDLRQIITEKQTEGFSYTEFVCYLRADDNSIIKRSGEHTRTDDYSTLTLDIGLKEGVYRLLYLEYDTPDCERSKTAQYGLGFRIEVSEDMKAEILEEYSEWIGLSGLGRKDAPYIISCYQHLENLRDMTNSELKNNLLHDTTYFQQTADIDMDLASWNCDFTYGWLPIGASTNNPFRGIYDGGGYTISNLWSLRENSPGIGLFGFVEGGLFKNINLLKPQIKGWFGAGALIGTTIVSGDDHSKITYLQNCTTSSGYVSTPDDGIGSGGLVGSTDMYSTLTIESCNNKSTSVSGDYAVGGLIGAGTALSNINLLLSQNNASVTSESTGAGGLVGSADSTLIMACTNNGTIKGSTSSLNIGAGGLIGGGGVTYIYSSTNNGTVSGHEGVGGLIGSTRVGVEDELIYNTAVVSYCKNTGSVTGYSRVGGLCGEGQFGCYAGYNEGTVQSTYNRSTIGGVIGHSSLAVIYNTVNNGSILSAGSMAMGGIVGQSTQASLYANQNFGSISTTCYETDEGEGVGGIVGLSGNYTMINYCANMGSIQNSGTAPTGGLIGEIGDPREWSPMNIAVCVIGGVEIVLGALGPAISVLGELCEELPLIAGSLKFILMPVEIAHGLELFTDGILYFIGGWELFAEEPEVVEIIETELKEELTAHNNAIADDIKTLRDKSFVPSGSNVLFNAATYAQYNSNLQQSIDYCEASEENLQNINVNINLKREERYEENEVKKETRETIQFFITGACVAAGTVAFVTGLVLEGVSAGGASPYLAASAVFLVSAIGGVNSIIEGATDYENNAVVISQCMNLGYIDAASSENVGGLAGYAHDYSWFKDCVNAGKCTSENENSGGFVGHLKSRGEMTNCVQLGSGWNAQFAAKTNMPKESGLYYYEKLENESTYNSNNQSKGLSSDEMKQEDSFSDFIFGGECPIWMLEDASLPVPIPYRSEMEAAIEE